MGPSSMIPAVPYNVLAPAINPTGPTPSPLVKLYRVVKVCAVTRSGSIKPRAANRAGVWNRCLKHVFVE